MSCHSFLKSIILSTAVLQHLTKGQGVFRSAFNAMHCCGTVVLLISLNFLLGFSNVMSDTTEFWLVLQDSLLFDSVLFTLAGSYFSEPVFTNAMLLGLCWLWLRRSPTRRAGVILRKASFKNFYAAIRPLFHSAHGCRAPPSITY